MFATTLDGDGGDDICDGEDFDIGKDDFGGVNGDDDGDGDGDNNDDDGVHWLCVVTVNLAQSLVPCPNSLHPPT